MRHPKVPTSPRVLVLALLPLVLLPTLLLWGALFGGRDYVPFDLTTFAPTSITLDAKELAARRVGANTDITEKTLLCAPEYELARSELAEGRFPHWNPYVRGGAPLFANALPGFAYPFHWPMFFWSPERVFGPLAWLGFALAGVFMFGFLREIGLRASSALFGAIVFQLSGTLAANGHFFMRMETLIWLPAGFWALERMFKQSGRMRIPSFCAFVCALALTWLAGFPPYALPCSIALGLYMVVLIARDMHDRGAKSGLRLGGWFVGATIAGVLLAAVQLVPMLDYYPEAQRKLSQSSAELAQQGLDPLGLLGLLMPSPWGSPLETPELPYGLNPLMYLAYSRANPETGQLFYPANYNFTEYSMYLGILPLLCILLSFFQGSARFRYFAIPAFLGFLLFAFGGGFFRLIVFSIGDPLFAAVGAENLLNSLRSSPPMRFASVLAFLGAALAAMGLESGPETLSRIGRRVLLVVTSLLVVVSLSIFIAATSGLSDLEGTKTWIAESLSNRWKAHYPDVAGDVGVLRNYFGRYVGPALELLQQQSLVATIGLGVGIAWIALLPGLHAASTTLRRGRVLVVCALALSAGELFFAARRVNPTFPHREVVDTPVDEFLREQRVQRRGAGGVTIARVGRANPDPKMPIAGPPNLWMRHRVRDLNAYAFLDGRSWRPFKKIFGDKQMMREFWVKALPVDERLRHGLLDLYGLRYLLSDEEIKELGEPVIPPMREENGAFFVYERKTALPRAFLVPHAEYASDDEALERITATDFDPRKKVWIAGDAKRDEALPQCAKENVASIASAKVAFTKDEPSTVRIKISDCYGAWLVLSDTAMSHWRVHLDDQETTWKRANLSFRALWIPRGDHDVEFSYDGKPFRRGLLLSAAIAAGLLILMMLWLRRGKSDRDVVETGVPHT